MNNVFLGLPIPFSDIETLAAMIIHEYPDWQHHRAVHWTKPNCHHLTLHFFGPIDPQQLIEVVKAIDRYRTRGFSIKISRIFNFPKPSSSLLAAYVDLSSPLAKLYNQVERTIEAYHLSREERAYLPHITLCRARRKKILTMGSPLMVDYPIKMTELILYQTHSVAGGNEYLPLQRWLFK